jgi:hypothetical protein
MFRRKPDGSCFVPPVCFTRPDHPDLSVSLGMVIDTTGACVADAIVEVVRGQRSGERITQVTPCGAWDYDGGGFVFKDPVQR